MSLVASLECRRQDTDRLLLMQASSSERWRRTNTDRIRTLGSRTLVSRTSELGQCLSLLFRLFRDGFARGEDRSTGSFGLRFLRLYDGPLFGSN